MPDQAYTITELTELSDAALNAMAAELRGPQFTGLLGEEEINAWEFPEKPARDNYTLQIRAADWTPATDSNQSGKLLQWAIKTDLRSNTAVYIETSPLLKTILGNDARAETIAFCAAMLAMRGQLNA